LITCTLILAHVMGLTD
jgi:uncharacterized membrane protein YozB (DUF420 family)